MSRACEQYRARRRTSRTRSRFTRPRTERSSVKVIVCFTARVSGAGRDGPQGIEVENEESVLVIDARSDTEPSASNA